MRIHRFARCFAFTASGAFIAYVLRNLIVMMAARQGVEAIHAAQTYFFFAINLLTAAIVAMLNRRYVFRSDLTWTVAIPVMVVLELLFDMLTGMLWQPVIRTMLEPVPDMQMGAVLQTASYAFSLIQFMIWAVLAYLFQRFVLYRESLDTNQSANDKGVHPYE